MQSDLEEQEHNLFKEHTKQLKWDTRIKYLFLDLHPLSNEDLAYLEQNMTMRKFC